MVYCDQDMCESKLGRLMQAFRSDRPDEWTMDEFIGMAEQMHKDIEALRQSEKDAARYRWLRDVAVEHDLCISVSLESSEWDEFIDDATQCNGDNK